MVRERSEGEGLLNDSVAIVHFGGLGDVVLLSEVVARFRASSPDASLVVYCREAYAPVVAQYAVPANRVVAVPIDPYRSNPPAEFDVAAARAFFEGLAAEPPGLLVAPEIVPTWLTHVAIDVLRPARVRMLESEPVPGVAYDYADEALRGDARGLNAAVAPSLSVGRSVLPALVIDQAAPRRAGSAGSDKSGSYLAVFPFGEARVPWKMWPIASYAELLARLAPSFDAGIVLVGARAESEKLDDLRARLAHVTNVDVVAGDSSDLAHTFARIAGARAFVGNDTGLSHAATALGVPGVTIFGGGTWPAYRPWGLGSVGVVAPLPCFGCSWSCAFDRGFCLELIDVESVESAVRTALEAPGAPPRVVTLETVTPRERDVIAHSARHLRAVESRARLDVEQRDAQIGIVERAASERLEALVAVSKVGETVDELGQAATERLEELQRVTLEMQRVARERDELATTARLYESVAAERLAALENVSAELERSRERATVLENEAEERLGRLFEAQSAAQNAQEAFEFEVTRLRSELVQSQELAATYEAVAAERLAALERTTEDAGLAAESYRVERAAIVEALHDRESAAADGASEFAPVFEAWRRRAEVAEEAAAARLDALERTSEAARLAAEGHAALAASLGEEIEALRARAEAAEHAAAERLEVLERVNAEAEAAAERHREERETLARALGEIEGASALGHEVVTSELESMRSRALVAESAAHERLETLERTASEARIALARYEEERQDLLVAAIDRRESAVDLGVVTAELEALRARTLVAEQAARDRLEALLESSEEMRRISEEAERRSVLIAELTALVASQHEQIDKYSRRAGAKT